MGNQGQADQFLILMSRGAISPSDRGWSSSPHDAAWKCPPLFTPDSHAGRLVCLSLLREYVELYELSLLGCCLMSNHVHL